jgi:hypothetical protein
MYSESRYGMIKQKESLENYLLSVAAALFYYKLPKDSLFELVEPPKVTVSSFSDWYANRTRQQKYRMRKALDRLRSKGYVALSFSTAPPSLELTDVGKREYLRRCIAASKIRRPSTTALGQVLTLVHADAPRGKDMQTMHLFLHAQQCKKIQPAVWLCSATVLPNLRNAADILDLDDAITVATLTSVHKLSDTDSSN